MIRNPVPTSYRDWHGYEEEKNRPSDVISISHRSYVSLNGYTFRVHEHVCVRSIMLVFAIFNVFH